jgi:ABC-type multidrug transport system fused ATPase/permease subunit
MEIVEKIGGLDENVGAGGGQLSGGQKQRIALARAFIKKPKLLIFDEATSALDKKNEAEVQKSIDDMAKKFNQVTQVVIAHRLSTIKNADHIIVMNNGKVAEQGSHAELIMNPDGLYSQLVKTQESAE